MDNKEIVSFPNSNEDWRRNFQQLVDLGTERTILEGMIPSENEQRKSEPARRQAAIMRQILREKFGN